MKTLLFSLLVAVGLPGCSNDKSASPKAEPVEVKVVKPGSHDDWCEEHHVAESQCTLCDPKLAAAFKATGDWCVEHNMPESQCRKCNPDLKIVRPSKDGN